MEDNKIDRHLPPFFQTMLSSSTALKRYERIQVGAAATALHLMVLASRHFLKQ